MIDVSAKVELKRVENALRRLQLAGRDLQPLFRSVRKDVRADQRAHAKAEKGPDGKWPGLAASTLAKRTRQGTGRRHRGKMKRKRRKFPLMLGRLPRSFAITYSRSWIKATSRAKWSGAHQNEGSATVGHGAVLKDRTFLWASTNLLATLVSKIGDYMKAAWDKGA